MNSCSMDGCASVVEARKLCNKHYLRLRRYGDPLFTKLTRSGRGYTKEYSVYKHMKQRCLNDNDKSYHYYGGRGIKVCDRWLADIENFIEDMGNVKPGMTLERIDNDGDYTPENCRWATMKEQCNNRRNSHWVTYGGETKTLTQWGDTLGLSYKVLHDRINKLSWPIEKALTTAKIER